MELKKATIETKEQKIQRSREEILGGFFGIFVILMLIVIFGGRKHD